MSRSKDQSGCGNRNQRADVRVNPRTLVTNFMWEVQRIRSGKTGC